MVNEIKFDSFHIYLKEKITKASQCKSQQMMKRFRVKRMKAFTYIIVKTKKTHPLAFTPFIITLRKKHKKYIRYQSIKINDIYIKFIRIENIKSYFYFSATVTCISC